MLMPADIAALAEQVIAALRAEGRTVATAESCTGGLIAGALTSISGSSDVVYGGFVTYSNAAKEAMIGVPAALIAAHGAVSEEVARAMAERTRQRTAVDMAIAVTGIAGPTGGSAEKPVGLVHFACAAVGGTTHRRQLFRNMDRAGVRHATVVEALRMILEATGD
jgi:nicotinamide-nucleotide amidase